MTTISYIPGAFVMENVLLRKGFEAAVPSALPLNPPTWNAIQERGARDRRDSPQGDYRVKRTVTSRFTTECQCSCAPNYLLGLHLKKLTVTNNARSHCVR